MIYAIRLVKEKLLCPILAGTIWAIGFTNISSGKICFETSHKCNLPNEYEDLKIYNIENKDIILPPITRKTLNIKQLNQVIEQDKMIYSNRAVYIRVNPDKYSPDFLFHVLSTQKYIYKLIDEAYTNGSYTGTYQISIEKLKQINIPDISIKEQLKILEEEEKLNKEINKLTKQKDLLYESY